ncbi:flavin reductase family protein, partial [Oscillibacter sp.]|uniref:flavin reductase family protein n=1 Tax=Oscillibacter sp. TaxID=1945593 RepID=UPI0028A63873
MAKINAKAYEAMDYGMYLISTSVDGKRQGCIVTSFAQVTSSRPPRFTVTLNRDHSTTEAILASGVFSVTLLGKDCPEEIINTFGYKSGRVGDKFAAFEP